MAEPEILDLVDGRRDGLRVARRSAPSPSGVSSAPTSTTGSGCRWTPCASATSSTASGTPGRAPWAVERRDRVRRTAERPRDRRLPRLPAPGPGVRPRPRRPAAGQRDGADSQATPDPAFPLHLMGCPRLRARPGGRVRPPRADLRRGVPVPLVGVDLVGRPRRRVRADDARGARPGRRRPGHRDREQRRLPARAGPGPRASASWVSSRPVASPTSPGRRACRRSRSSSVSRRPGGWWPSTGIPRLVAANNVMAHVPDLVGLHRRPRRAVRRPHR